MQKKALWLYGKRRKKQRRKLCQNQDLQKKLHIISSFQHETWKTCSPLIGRGKSYPKWTMISLASWEKYKLQIVLEHMGHYTTRVKILDIGLSKVRHTINSNMYLDGLCRILMCVQLREKNAEGKRLFEPFHLCHPTLLKWPPMTHLMSNKHEWWYEWHEWQLK
jgi:hypothetical protein